MSPTLLLVLRLSLLLLFFLACLLLERRDKRLYVVLLVLGVVVLDGALYPNSNAKAVESIFHPNLMGQNFRLVQLLIPLALMAALLVRGIPRRWDGSAIFWFAFFGWVLAEAVVGLLAGHTPKYVFGEGAVIVQLGGAMLLAAGVPAEDYVNRPALRRFLQASAVVAVVLFVTDVMEIRFTSNTIPDLPLQEAGTIGADSATVLTSLGVLALVMGVARPRHLGRRAVLIIPAALLILSHLASTQRAARLGLYVSLLVVLVIACLPTARRRLSFSLGQVGFAAACLAAIGFGMVFVPAVVNAAAPQTVVAAPDTDRFAPTSRQGSIQSRFNQWEVVRGRIAERPLTGEGLGGTFLSFDEGDNAYVETNISHNIALDVIRRTGAVGAVLGVSALLAVLAQAILTWRFHPNTQVAALAAATIAVTAGLLAKGMVESILEKHRLAVLLGVVLGIAISCYRSGSGRLGLQRALGPVEESRAVPVGADSAR